MHLSPKASIAKTDRPLCGAWRRSIVAFAVVALSVGWAAESPAKPSGGASSIAPPPSESKSEHWRELAQSAQSESGDESALRAARNAYKLSPDDPLAAYELGRQLAYAGEMENAERLLIDAYRAAPDNGDIALFLARVHAWQGEHDAALRILDDLTSEQPDWFDANALRGKVLLWASRFDEAVDVLAPLHAARPSDRDVEIDLIDALTLAGDYRDARHVIAERQPYEDWPERAERRRAFEEGHPPSRADISARYSFNRDTAQGRDRGDWVAFDVGLSHRLADRFTLGVGAKFDARDFTSVWLRDTTLRLFGQIDLAPRWNLQLTGAYTPDHDFAPQWLAQADLGFEALSMLGFFLTYRVAHYDIGNFHVLAPGLSLRVWRLTVSPSLLFAFPVFEGVFAPNTVTLQLRTALALRKERAFEVWLQFGPEAADEAIRIRDAQANRAGIVLVYRHPLNQRMGFQLFFAHNRPLPREDDRQLTQNEISAGYYVKFWPYRPWRDRR